jgi:predicted Fe-Mo cluster-binding NifX family protein
MKKKTRIAVATHGKAGLKDEVSEVFGRSKTFTIIDVENGYIVESWVIANPAFSYEHGAGPIAVKELVDNEINLVISSELGPGASSILKHHHITAVTVKAGTTVSEAVENALKEMK